MRQTKKGRLKLSDGLLSFQLKTAFQLASLQDMNGKFFH